MSRAPRSLGRRQALRGIAGLGLAATAGLPLWGGCRDSTSSPSAREQAPDRVSRVGWLARGEPDRASSPFDWPNGPPGPAVQRFLDRLAELGYVEGRTLHWEWRRAPAGDQLSAAAVELATLSLDLILILGDPVALRAAFQAPGTTPIVVGLFLGDPVRDGYAQSLARPGGKVTGLLLQPPNEVFGPKLLETYQEVLPALRRLGVLLDIGPENLVGRDAFLAFMSPAARDLGIELVIEEVRELDEVDGAFARMARAGVDGAWPFVRVQWTGLGLAPRIIGEALRYRLPIMGPQIGWPAAGALFAYGPNFLAVYARTADYVDKVLRGARPADLPIEQPNSYDLVINKQTADTLGLTIPPAVLGRATEVIR
jgi:putative ABC transport system substrate-binding protein